MADVSALTTGQREKIGVAVSRLEAAIRHLTLALDEGAEDVEAWEYLLFADNDMVAAEENLSGIDKHLLSQFSNRSWARRARGEIK